MFKMGRQGAVRRPDSPAVLLVYGDSPCPDVDHRFDGEDHARLELGREARQLVVRDLGILVHLPAAAMSDHVPHDGETGGLDDLFDGCSDVAHAVARHGGGDARLQRAACRLEKLVFQRRGDAACDDGTRVVPREAADGDADVQRDDVTGIDDFVRASDAVDDDFVDRAADLGGVTVVVQEGAFTACLLDEFGGEPVQIKR